MDNLTSEPARFYCVIMSKEAATSRGLGTHTCLYGEVGRPPWKEENSNPDAGVGVSLCVALGGNGRGESMLTAPSRKALPIQQRGRL